MASIDFAKMPPAALNELDVHFETSIRMKAKHSNIDINQLRTAENYNIGCDTWKECAERMKEMIEAVDKKQPPKRIRADRKTWVSIYVPCPKSIEDMGCADEFFEKSYHLINSVLPLGLAGGQVHKDEKHIYKEKGQEKESLLHGHYWGVAYTPEYGINMKNFLTKERIQELQDKMQEMVQQEFGVSYQTGDFVKNKEKYKKAVEELKTNSIEENLKDMQQVLSSVSEQIAEKEKQKMKLVAEIDKSKADLEEYTKEIEESMTIMTKIIRCIQEFMPRFYKAYEAIQRVFEHWQKNDLKIYKTLVEKTNPIISRAEIASKELEKCMHKISTGVIPDNNDVEAVYDNLKETTEELERISEEYDY